ncbi:hypothetical protein PR048_015264 [Dryococelus australis]|uniref:Uncharacterized protein n=1 Tax=Dryococelus australis TaxID=614101 RepID=A0ABQ9HGG7_9NEOP|nr:hypothetical protein PR048_015264 [Dryococelus australis]
MEATGRLLFIHSSLPVDPDKFMDLLRVSLDSRSFMFDLHAVFVDAVRTYGRHVSIVCSQETNARLHHRGSKLEPRSDLRSTQKTEAPFEFRAGLDIEMNVQHIAIVTSRHTPSRRNKSATDVTSQHFPAMESQDHVSTDRKFSTSVFRRKLGFACQGRPYLYAQCEPSRGTAVAERLACSPPTKANRVQAQAESQDLRMWESCRTMPLVVGPSRGYPAYPAPSFRRYSILPSITLISSQDLAIKSRPNLFTLHSRSGGAQRCEHTSNYKRIRESEQNKIGRSSYVLEQKVRTWRQERKIMNTKGFINATGCPCNGRLMHVFVLLEGIFDIAFSADDNLYTSVTDSCAVPTVLGGIESRGRLEAVYPAVTNRRLNPDYGYPTITSIGKLSVPYALLMPVLHSSLLFRLCNRFLELTEMPVGTGETGDPRGNLLTSGIVRHYYHIRKSRSYSAWNLIWFDVTVIGEKSSLKKKALEAANLLLSVGATHDARDLPKEIIYDGVATVYLLHVYQTVIRLGRGGVAARTLTSLHDEPGSIPGGVVGIAGRRVFLRVCHFYHPHNGSRDHVVNRKCQLEQGLLPPTLQPAPMMPGSTIVVRNSIGDRI